MNYTIRTRFLNCTDTKDNRILASCETRQTVVPLDYMLTMHENHAAAKNELMKKMGWDTIDRNYVFPVLIGGVYKDDMYWVFDAESDKIKIDSVPDAVIKHCVKASIRSLIAHSA